MTQVNADNALAIYRVGPVLCCAPTRTVTAIIEPPANLTHPPGSTASSPGIFAFNKKVVAVTDLRYRFGVPESNWKHPGRMIIVDQEDGSRGYWVDDIIDVVEMPTSGWQALPPHLPRGIFKSTLLIKDKILLYAEFDKLAKITGTGYLREYIEELYAQHSSKLQASLVSANSSASNKHGSTSSDKKDTPTTKSTHPSSISSSAAQVTRLPVVGKPTQKNGTESSAKAIQQHASTHNDKTEPVTRHGDNEKISTAASNQDQVQHPSRDKKVRNNVVPFKSVSNMTDSTKTMPGASKSSDRSSPSSTAKIPPHADSTKPDITKNARPENIEPTATRKSLPAKDIHTPHRHAQVTNRQHYEANKQTINGETTSHVASASSPKSGETSSRVVPNTDTALTHSSGKRFLIVFSLIILLCAAAGFYYLRSDVTGNSTTPVSSYSPAPIIIPALRSDKTADDANIANNSQGAINKQEMLTQEVTPSPTSKATIPDPDQHHASIEHDEQGIAIVLTSPNKPEFKTQVQKTPANQSSNMTAEPNNTKNTTDKFALYSLPEAISLDVPSLQNPSKIKYEFTHVVVTGDTLWHIAIRYLHDPYRYPELAQLSKIKNPDLIYPGNNIRIIYQSR